MFGKLAAFRQHQTNDIIQIHYFVGNNAIILFQIHASQ